MTKKEIQLQAERAADNFRRKFDLGQNDPLDFESLLYKLDLLTIFAKMSDNFSGMAAKFGDNSFILINSELPRGRQHFTICHELYHLFVQDDFKFEIISNNWTDSKDINEKLADAFAIELLVPEKGIKEILLDSNYLNKHISLDLIVKLEQYFKVSRRALIYRLQNLNLLKIDEAEKEALCSNVIDSAVKRGYSSKLYEKTSPGIISSDYSEKATYLYNKEVIGLTDYAKLLSEIGIDVFELIDNPNH